MAKQFSAEYEFEAFEELGRSLGDQKDKGARVAEFDYSCGYEEFPGTVLEREYCGSSLHLRIRFDDPKRGTRWVSANYVTPIAY